MRDLWSAALVAADLIPGDVSVASRRRIVAALVAGRRVELAAGVATAAIDLADRHGRTAARRSFVRRMRQTLDAVQRRQVAGGLPPFSDAVVEGWKNDRRREWAQRQAQGGGS